VNIPAHFSVILERLVKILAFVLKGVISIGKLKNGYRVLIVVSLHPLLVADAHYMLEAIMLLSIIRGKKELMSK